MAYLQPPYIYYGVAVLIIIAVLLLAVMVARAIGGRVRGRRGSRLGISEFREIDKQRRLVLVRRDGVEHLLLIGGNEDLVVETGITGDTVGQRSRRRAAPSSESERSELVEPELRVVKPRPAPAPRPPVFGDHTPTLRPVDREPPKIVSGGPKQEDE